MKYDFINFDSIKTGKMRILSQPWQYLAHSQYYRTWGGNPHRQRLGCTRETGYCPLCQKGMKPTNRWLVAILERQSNQVKLMDIDNSMFDQLRLYTRDRHWGDPSNYDISWLQSNHVYIILASPKTPLTQAEEELKNAISITQLSDLCDPSNRCLQALINQVIRK